MRNLLAEMESRGITIEQVAEACEHRPETVARWLRGEGRGFWVDDAVCIHQLLFPDVSLDEFMTCLVESRRDAVRCSEVA